MARGCPACRTRIGACGRRRSRSSNSTGIAALEALLATDRGRRCRTRPCARRRKRLWGDRCSKNRTFRCPMMSSGFSGILSTATAAYISTMAPSSSLERRLSRRLEQHRLKTFEEYYHFLRYDRKREEELAVLVDNLTTNETYFFRESPQLRAFSEEILPELRQTLADRKVAPDLERRLLHGRGALHHRHAAARVRGLVARLAGGDPRQRYQPAGSAHGPQGRVQKERAPRLRRPRC